MSSEGILFCDGASRGNPGPSGWGYVLRLDGEIEEAGGREDLATNNQMELRALYEALASLKSREGRFELKICLDSKYVLDSAERYLHAWKKRGWVTVSGEEIKNKELWMKLSELLESLRTHIKFTWVHVPGHRGIPGNERCDEIASSFADGLDPVLYRGPASDYQIDLDAAQVQAKDYSSAIYLSYIDGEVFRDKDWKSCEARVKGRRSAKYKKVRNTLEEKATLKNWGLED